MYGISMYTIKEYGMRLRTNGFGINGREEAYEAIDGLDEKERTMDAIKGYVSNTRYNRTSWTTQHALSSDHLPIITTINIRHDYRLTTTKPTDRYQLQESRLDTIYRRHRVRLRLDHHTHQHTHCQQNFHKHHTDGRQAEHTKGQDA